MTIKEGYDDKPTNLKITHCYKKDRTAMVAICQEGIDFNETTSIITIDELLTLKEEINIALKSIILNN